MMDTTVNINIGVLEKIDEAAQSRDLSCSALIVILLKKIMNEKKMNVRTGMLVQYQERGLPGGCQPFHVRFQEDEYECFLYLRKLWKMSVSLILALAVKKYLNEQLDEKISDNYPCKNKISVVKYLDGLVLWKLFGVDPPLP